MSRSHYNTTYQEHLSTSCLGLRRCSCASDEYEMSKTYRGESESSIRLNPLTQNQASFRELQSLASHEESHEFCEYDLVAIGRIG